MKKNEGCRHLARKRGEIPVDTKRRKDRRKDRKNWNLNLFKKALTGLFVWLYTMCIAVEADRIARASKTPGNGFDSRQLHHNIKGINYET